MKTLNYSDATLKEGKKQAYYARLRAMEHKGEWLTMEIAEEYHKKALTCTNDGGQDIGGRRKLRIELQTKYGLTEIEATNIIGGHHIAEYAEKYEAMREAKAMPVRKA